MDVFLLFFVAYKFGFLVFLGVVALCLLGMWQYFALSHAEQDRVGAGSYIEKTAVVVDALAPGTDGKVMFEGTLWNAPCSGSGARGDIVRIVAVEGLVLVADRDTPVLALLI